MLFPSGTLNDRLNRKGSKPTVAFTEFGIGLTKPQQNDDAHHCNRGKQLPFLGLLEGKSEAVQHEPLENVKL